VCSRHGGHGKYPPTRRIRTNSTYQLGPHFAHLNLPPHSWAGDGLLAICSLLPASSSSESWSPVTCGTRGGQYFPWCLRVGRTRRWHPDVEPARSEGRSGGRQRFRAGSNGRSPVAHIGMGTSSKMSIVKRPLPSARKGWALIRSRASSRLPASTIV